LLDYCCRDLTGHEHEHEREWVTGEQAEREGKPAGEARVGDEARPRPQDEDARVKAHHRICRYVPPTHRQAADFIFDSHLLPCALHQKFLLFYTTLDILYHYHCVVFRRWRTCPHTHTHTHTHTHSHTHTHTHMRFAPLARRLLV
jgi:hypothetical protein